VKHSGGQKPSELRAGARLLSNYHIA
jgi:hypothetical protein